MTNQYNDTKLAKNHTNESIQVNTLKKVTTVVFAKLINHKEKD